MNLVFDQSSPVQPVSEFRGGPLSVTDKRMAGRKSSFLIFLIGYTVIVKVEEHTNYGLPTLVLLNLVIIGDYRKAGYILISSKP